MAAFQRVIDRYEALHPKIKIDLDQVTFKFEEQLDTRIAAHVGPDMFRLQYLNMGRYTPSQALADLSPFIPRNLGDEFTAPVWTAVTYKGRPYALPHHTDTSAIQYNKTLFDQLGIHPPKQIEKSWTWQEFENVARAVQRKTQRYSFAVNWTFGGSFRWLNFLNQRGGSLLDTDFQHPAVPSIDAIETLRWTQSWFQQGLVPASDSARSSEDINNLFVTGVVGMIFNYGLDTLRVAPPSFEWDVTFLPRDRQMAAELGGNAVGVSRDCKHPQIAADFLLFLTNESNMRDFAISAGFIPVRRALVDRVLPFAYRPDCMKVYTAQSLTVPSHLAQTVTLPVFPRIHRRLGEQLNLAFSAGQDPELTLSNIAEETRRALAST